MNNLTSESKISILDKEQEWISMSKKNPEYFKPIYEHYFKLIFRFIYDKTRDKDLTADLVSQVFVKALTNLNKYTYQGFPFSSWLYKIASNEIAAYYRKSNKNRWVNIDEHMLEGIFEDTKGPDLENLRQGLEKVIEGLSHMEVQILELRYYENKSYKEIGYMLSLSETNVKTKSFRIIEKIRSKIKISNE